MTIRDALAADALAIGVSIGALFLIDWLVNWPGVSGMAVVWAALIGAFLIGNTTIRFLLTHSG